MRGPAAHWSPIGFKNSIFLHDIDIVCRYRLASQEYKWCENVGGWTFVTLISLFITLFGIVAGVMASCCSMGLYVDERLEDEEENK